MEKIKSVLIKHKVLVVLSLLIIIGFCYRFYPATLVAEFSPADEYLRYLHVNYLLKTGEIYSPGFSPQLMSVTIAGIYKLLLGSVSTLWLGKMFNPLIGALTAIPLYYLCRSFTSKNNSLLASTLFTFSDMHFYRSAYFGQSETLGMFFMFLFLMFYTRKRSVFHGLPLNYVFCGLFLLAMFYSHLIPFVFTIAVVAIHLVIKKPSVKRVGLFVGIVIATSLLITGPFSSHQRTAFLFNLTRIFGYFDIKKLLITYSVEQLWLGTKLMIGSIVLGLVVLFYYSTKLKKNFSFSYLKKLHKTPTFTNVAFTMFIVGLLGVFITWLGYDANLMAPTRFTPYVSLALIALFAQVKVKKKSYLTIFLVITMLMGPLVFDGININLWVYDAATPEEIAAIKYVRENNIIDFSKTNFGEWFADRSIHCVIWYNTVFYAKTPIIMTSAYSSTMHAEAVTENQEKVTTANVTGYRYIFYSERMEKGGFVLHYYPEFHRLLPIHMPIERPEIPENQYTLLYEKDGVWIYERK